MTVEHTAASFGYTGYRSPRDRIRWFPLKNMEQTETIPGFALVMLKKGDRNGFFTQEMLEQQAVWRGYRPDADAEALQDPAMLVVNGPTPIPPGQIGKCTQDWPAQVLHDGSADSLPNAVQCGPARDSWYVWSGYSAFTCLSHDVTRAAPGTANGVHTAWIAPAHGVASPFSALTAGLTVSAGGTVTFGNTSATSTSKGAPPIAQDAAGLVTGYTMTIGGHWWVSVSATVSSTAAPEGSTLRLRVYDGTTGTYLTGHRMQTIGTFGTGPGTYYGGDPLYTAENIAFSGPLIIAEAGNVLSLKNDSAYDLVLADVIFSVHLLANPTENTGTLVYP